MSEDEELRGLRLVEEQVGRDTEPNVIVDAYRPGINDFANWMCKKISRPDIQRKAAKSIEDITRKAVVLVRRKMFTEEYLVTTRDELDRVHKGAWRHDLSAGMGAMLRGFDARFTAMAAALLKPSIAWIISNSSDPIGLIKVMF